MAAGACAQVTAGRAPGPPGQSPVRGLAGLQGQPVDFSAGQVLVALVEVAAGVGRGLVGLEGPPVPVQLVEDPLQRLALDQVAGVDERAGLAGLDALDGLGHQPVVGLRAGLVLTREAHAQPEHQFPPGTSGPVHINMRGQTLAAMKSWPGDDEA